MNFKTFMSKWIEGMKNITPTQQLEIKTSSYFGSILGLIFAFITLLIAGSWQFSIFLIFMIILQYMEWVGARQAWKNALEIEKMLKEQNIKLGDEKNGFRKAI